MSILLPKSLHKLPDARLGSLLLGDEEMRLLQEVIQAKTLNRYYAGPDGQKPMMAATLEAEFSKWLGGHYCLGVTSGTAALEVALTSMGIGPGDEVIIPAWSWCSCYMSVVRTGALPVMGEIDESFCLDPTEIERLVTPRTKAVMVIHFQGASADMEAIMQLARHHNLLVLEDCAQSLGATCHGQKVGTFGDAAIFSFQHQKIITSGEGGLFATKDSMLYERAVRFHDLGKYRPYHETISPSQAKEFSGGQYRMSELTAAVALAQFRKLPLVQRACRPHFERLCNAISDIPALSVRPVVDRSGDSGYAVYIRLPNEDKAKSFRLEMEERGVPCARLTGTYPHYQGEYCREGTAFHDAFSPKKHFSTWPAEGFRPDDFPKTQSIVAKYVTMAIGVSYSNEDLDFMITNLQEVANNVMEQSEHYRTKAAAHIP